MGRATIRKSLGGAPQIRRMCVCWNRSTVTVSHLELKVETNNIVGNNHKNTVGNNRLRRFVTILSLRCAFCVWLRSTLPWTDPKMIRWTNSAFFDFFSPANEQISPYFLADNNHRVSVVDGSPLPSARLVTSTFLRSNFSLQDKRTRMFMVFAQLISHDVLLNPQAQGK